MPRTLRSQYLFLSSANRTNGQPYDFAIDLGDASIACLQTEALSLSLVEMNIFSDWLTTNPTNNSFGFRNLSTNTTTNVSLTPGNYAYRDLANTINGAYALVYTTYDRSLNKLRCEFSTPHEIILTGKSNLLLGFAAGEVPSGTVIYSSQVLRPRLVNNINVEVGGVTAAAPGNADNFATPRGAFKRSNMLVSVPINAEPFDLIRFSAGANAAETELQIHEKKLTTLFFRLTGFDGSLLDFIGDWTAVLRVSVVDPDGDSNSEVASLLNKMVEMQRLSLVAGAFGSTAK